MTILVYGAGAVGCFVGAVLAAAGHRVILIGRPTVIGPAARGLSVQMPGASPPQRVAAVQTASSLEEAAQACARPDLVIFTMKSFATGEAADAVAGRWPGEGPPFVLSVQNGLGNEEAIAAAVGEARTLAGALTMAVSLPAPGTVRGHQRRGGMAVAPLAAEASPMAEGLADALRAGGLPAVTARDWRAIKWSKLLLNLLGNATCALLDEPPAECLADRRVFTIERRAFREAVSVMRAVGVPITDLPGYPVRLLTRVLLHLPLPVAHRLLYRRLAGGRGDKIPSLLADLRRGRTRTEAAALYGAVSSWGRRAGVSTPTNDALWRALAGVADGTLPWDRFRHQPEALLAFVSAGNAAARP